MHTSFPCFEVRSHTSEAVFLIPAYSGRTLPVLGLQTCSTVLNPSVAKDLSQGFMCTLWYSQPQTQYFGNLWISQKQLIEAVAGNFWRESERVTSRCEILFVLIGAGLRPVQNGNHQEAIHLLEPC